MVAGPRRAAGAAADASVRRAAHHVQRADRRCATGRRAVVGASTGSRAIKAAAGVTFNDVILGDVLRCVALLPAGRAGAARHPADRDGPGEHAFRADDADSGGNQVGALLCNLATDVDDPAKRLETINAVDARQQEGVRRIASAASLCVVRGSHRAAGTVRAAGLRLDGTAAVQHRHLQRAGADRADVLGRRPPRRQLPAVDRAGRAGAEHHDGQQRRQHRFRLWSDAGEVCRTCSGCSVTWKPH